MVRGRKKMEDGKDEERNNLKKLAVSRNIFSQTPTKHSSSLIPSKSIIKHDGRDIVKKSQRKNKYLFSFPGLLAPITGGNIGELKDLSTKKPILYLDFPQGQMKLFGTIVHPKNRYLTLQFSMGGKTVVCEDNFDNMIVFSDAWWIGKKDENPEELRLEFPMQMTEGKHADYDFKGGAGSTSEQKSGPSKPGKEQDEPQSPEAHVVDDVSEDSSALTTKKKDMMEVTPVRHSTRTAGKTFKLAEASSEDDSMKNGSDSSDLMEKRDIESLDDVVPGSTVRNIQVYTDDFSRATGSVDIAARPDSLEENKKSSVTGKSKEIYVRKKGPLVQATLYSSFGKANKKTTESVGKSSLPKGTALMSIGSKRKVDQMKIRDFHTKAQSKQDEGPQKKEIPVKERKIGTKENTKKSKSQVEDDDIEEFSSESEDIDGSDEDWTM